MDNPTDLNSMTDAELVDKLERCELAQTGFPHAGHLRVAHFYLSRHEWLDAACRMKQSLRRFAANAGKENLYHETITLAFLAVIAERMASDENRCDSAPSWPRMRICATARCCCITTVRK